ncbi:hypothetical protein AOLI_G00237480 [Acnodon oligacanthus]
MAVGASLSKDLSYLYERLLYKLSDEGFHDMLSMGGFLVIFIFCTITLMLMLVVVVSWCSERCFKVPTRSNKVGIRATSAPTEMVPAEEQRSSKKKRPRTVRGGGFRVKCKTHPYRRPKVLPIQKEPRLSTETY